MPTTEYHIHGLVRDCVVRTSDSDVVEQYADNYTITAETKA